MPDMTDKEFEKSLDLAEALGLDLTPTATKTQRSKFLPTFENIKKFHAEFGRLPRSESNNLQEMLAGTELDTLVTTPQALDELRGHDPDGLLDMAVARKDGNSEAEADDESPTRAHDKETGNSSSRPSGAPDDPLDTRPVHDGKNPSEVSAAPERDDPPAGEKTDSSSAGSGDGPIGGVSQVKIGGRASNDLLEGGGGGDLLDTAGRDESGSNRATEPGNSNSRSSGSTDDPLETHPVHDGETLTGDPSAPERDDPPADSTNDSSPTDTGDSPIDGVSQVKIGGRAANDLLGGEGGGDLLDPAGRDAAGSSSATEAASLSNDDREHGEEATKSRFDDMSGEELLAELGEHVPDNDLYDLKFVRSSEERRAAEEIARRERCPDFAKFKPQIDRVDDEIQSGVRKTTPVKDRKERVVSIKQGHYFILGGQTALVAEVEAEFRNNFGDLDSRLRVIFSNGTQSRLLRTSLRKAMYEDETSRIVLEPEIFKDIIEPGESISGHIYVVRSESDDPIIAADRAGIHKIGATTGSVERRVANSREEFTFLFADVRIIRTYALARVNPQRLEKLIHRIFEPVRCNFEMMDRNTGKPRQVTEWFRVGPDAIDEAVKRIIDGTIEDWRFDPDLRRLVSRE